MLTAVSTRSAPDRLVHKTVAAAVAESLRQRILTGEFPAGTQLRQDALADEFGISRIPIREALLQLEATGLIKIMPHRGAVVSGLSVEEVEDIFTLRVQLEPELLALSAQRFSAQDIQDLHGLTEEYSAALKSGEILRWGELNQRFHLDLLRHAGRPRSLSIVAGLLQDCDRPTRLQLSTSGDVARADREHRAIIALCAAGQIDEAADHLRRHIQHAAHSLIAIYRRALGV
ncbi:GntR family transcriptional regulator [Methylobacterium sp. J-077]|uniref:GntR family transcriptional regulator n=1 Tax=Methylobacterium sp. J-077 TaxID=2836656 RepID=UPI001FBBE75A|nr:GntR family transcriptional regulator [Methylobacterium sp. J-077]MCJ2127095.1 GntR family transcriptional regulator [Methylobacterium sp. J-077]